MTVESEVNHERYQSGWSMSSSVFEPAPPEFQVRFVISWDKLGSSRENKQNEVKDKQENELQKKLLTKRRNTQMVEGREKQSEEKADKRKGNRRSCNATKPASMPDYGVLIQTSG